MCLGLIIGAWAATSGRAATGDQGLGDGDDGNRSTPVHVITLFDDLGREIDPAAENPRPVSMRHTCGQCHNYDTIAGGWHFNSCKADPAHPDGRPGEPWVLSDAGTRTQIPVSNRGWRGAYRPAELRLSAWQWVKAFGTHYPGGNYGEIKVNPDDETADPEAIIRQPISGLYEVNCLVCHNADRRQDQGTDAGASMQVARQNYRWVATVGAGLGRVSGTALAIDEFSLPPDPDQITRAIVSQITTTYDKTRFDSVNKVFLDIVRSPPDDRCYFCHSTQPIIKDASTAPEGEAEASGHGVGELTEALAWIHDRDVHLASGLTCTDCHRNGDDHMITRGHEEQSHGGLGHVSTLSCRGCHLGDETADAAAAEKGGRLGAPRPRHAGIPTIHFEELACTACHSGPWPRSELEQVRTARVHKLGLHGKHAANLHLPHVLTPVFARQADGKIAPHKMFWPAFWGMMVGDEVKPMLPQEVALIAAEPLGLNLHTTDRINDWEPLDEETIAQVLGAIAADVPLPEGEEAAKPEAVYIAGGKLYRLDGETLISQDHPAAVPYAWPIAHNVRPATQSLGMDGECADCHDNTSPFFFASVPLDTPVAQKTQDGWIQTLEARPMVAFQEGIRPTYIRWFNWSFVFRPMMKITVLACCGLIAAVLVLYGLKALRCVAAAVSDENESC